ncbi:MAG TPA: hypothetical protein VM513_08250 [Kofleriaceae bacterium]|jgi:hypothetical protein|nr:hypothetical protein [Kofleriaceae bacterium]
MARWLVAVLVLAACKEHAPSKERFAPDEIAVAPPATSCLADGLGPLTAAPTFGGGCSDAGECELACTNGVANACVERAFLVQDANRKDPAANEWFARACKLGEALGCTNVAAYLWLAKQPATDADTACAKRLFERACAAREAIACGMLGRVALAEAETPEQRQAARQKLATACEAYGGMSCWMYATHLEQGDLGPPEPGTVRTLMQRACATGFDEACGRETAGETARGSAGD